MSNLHNPTRHKMLQRVFKVLDEDGDGELACKVICACKSSRLDTH